MASASCSAAMLPFAETLKPRAHVDSSSNPKDHLINDTPKTTRVNRLHSIRVKAAANNGNTKRNSVVCADCDGNGAVLCSQCKGSGVNSVDFFGGQFKAEAKGICYAGTAMELALLVVL